MRALTGLGRRGGAGRVAVRRAGERRSPLQHRRPGGHDGRRTADAVGDRPDGRQDGRGLPLPRQWRLRPPSRSAGSPTGLSTSSAAAPGDGLRGPAQRGRDRRRDPADARLVRPAGARLRARVGGRRPSSARPSARSGANGRAAGARRDGASRRASCSCRTAAGTGCTFVSYGDPRRRPADVRRVLRVHREQNRPYRLRRGAGGGVTGRPTVPGGEHHAWPGPSPARSGRSPRRPSRSRTASIRAKRAARERPALRRPGDVRRSAAP